MHAKAIRQLRDALGLTQDGFAARVEVSQATVSRWESGRTVPDVLARRRINALHGGPQRNGDIALLRMVRCAPSVMGLFDPALRILALSDPCARAAGLRPEDAVGADCRPLFGPDIDAILDVATDCGFFSGAVAGLDIACLLHGRDGSRLPVVGTWHLLPRPSDGDSLILWNARPVDPPTHAQARKPGPARPVTVEEWLNPAAAATPAPKTGADTVAVQPHRPPHAETSPAHTIA